MAERRRLLRLLALQEVDCRITGSPIALGAAVMAWQRRRRKAVQPQPQPQVQPNLRPRSRRLPVRPPAARHP